MASTEAESGSTCVKQSIACQVDNSGIFLERVIIKLNSQTKNVLQAKVKQSKPGTETKSLAAHINENVGSNYAKRVLLF